MNKKYIEDIKEELLQKRRIDGVKKYIEIQKEYNETKGKCCKSKEFRNKYISFYQMYTNRLGRINKNNIDIYYDKYFKLLENNYNNTNLNYKDILKELYIDNNIFKSYASKLLATINTNKIVWDDNVITAIKLYNSITFKDIKTIDDATDAYNYLEKLLKEYTAYTYIFDETLKSILPKEDIEYLSDVKKVDIMLWSVGNKYKKERKGKRK